MKVNLNRVYGTAANPEFHDRADLFSLSDAGLSFKLRDISGRPDRDMFVHIAKPPGMTASSKLAFLHHGRNGNAEAMRDIARAYHHHGYMTVAADARYSSGNDSAGEARNFTIGSHVEDLGRTISFVRQQAPALGWTGKKFALAGFSMGGYAASFMAATRYRENVSHLLAISPLTSGTRQIEARRDHPNGISNLKKELPMAMKEWPRHDIYKHITGIRVPVSVMVGADDKVTPPRHVKSFADALRELGVLASFDIREGGNHAVQNQKDNDFTSLVYKHIAYMEEFAYVKNLSGTIGSPRPS